MLGELSEALEEKNIKLVVNGGVNKLIAKKSFSKKFGARNMRRFIQSEIEDKLAEYIISNYDKNISSVELSEKNGDIVIKCK